MTPFNFFKDALKESILIRITKREKYYILAFKGSLGRWYDGNEVTLDSYDNRKKESDRSLDAEILVYDPFSESLDWKFLYRNTKGVYFKKEKSIYLNEAYSPEKSKRIFSLQEKIEERTQWMIDSRGIDGRDVLIKQWQKEIDELGKNLEKEYSSHD